MEHLDLEGMLSSSWMMPAFDQQDANFLSSSRQILEPIMEETSEDEDNQNWSHIENAWSSESDTGSVIRIEFHNDQDSISERDYACPAKRPRRDDLLIVEDNSPIRKFNRNETALAADIPEPFRKRFDELYSDSDTISYNSLSRSSSLIQFESLERQLQNDLPTSIGNSSPSLLSFDTTDGKGSQGSLRRFESSDGRLHQTYFDLDKIDFNDALMFSGEDRCHTKSDSESSDNSILSHEERILKPKIYSGGSDQRACYRGKNSAENLSEDSGYCEHITALRIKSKSIPNFLRANGKFCEEDEFENHKSMETIYTVTDKSSCQNREVILHSRNENVADFCGKLNFPKENKREMKTKIDAKRSSPKHYENDVKNKIHTSNDQRIKTGRRTASLMASPQDVSPPPPDTPPPFTSPSFRSSSLPDVRSIQFDHVFDANNPSDPQSYDKIGFDLDRYENNQFSIVSSVPNDLNLVIGADNCENNRDDNDVWNLRPTSVRSENRFSAPSSSFAFTSSSASNQPGRLSTSSTSIKPVQNYINASYNNLTLLDYSGKSNRNSFNMSDYSGNSKRNSREFELGKGNFLLDELSANFDRNLSILSDRAHDSDLITEYLEEERRAADEAAAGPPKPPTRRCNSKKEQRVTPAIEKPPRKNCAAKTFDQDPTNLVTSYAESLEKCNFDAKELSNNDLRIFGNQQTSPVKRGFVASTPNLNAFKNDHQELEDDLQVSSAHNSMNPLPGERKLGILIATGSRTSLGKGVSFCPVVSEISWLEQSSEECIEPDSLENVAHDLQLLEKAPVAIEETTQNVTQTNSNNTASCGQIAQSQSHTQPRSQSGTIVSNVSIGQVNGGIASSGSDESPTTKTVVIDVSYKSTLATNQQQLNKCEVISDRDSKQMQKGKNNSNYSCNLSGNNSGYVSMANAGIKNSSSAASTVQRQTTATVPPSTTANNTGTDLLSSKFKPKPDEKHHKNGFLSRFTGGFRFSLRRKKKQPAPAPDKNINETENQKQKLPIFTSKQSSKKSIAEGATKVNSNSQSSSKKVPDFIYIPLKGPPPAGSAGASSAGINGGSPYVSGEAERHMTLVTGGQNDNNHVLLGKPPLPKQPPRVVGVCEKIRASPQHQLMNGGGNGRHAPVFRSSSQPREIDERFLDNERRYYHNNSQLNGTMNGNGCSSGIGSVPQTGISPAYCPDAGSVVGASTAGCVGANSTNKIGLIETNLDTHETVISGKTRSLMELGPHQQIRHTLGGSKITTSRPTDPTDGCSKRPHKSMEFLLDKENQKNVLPPENELQKSHDSSAALSEHQLRVQASLQRLNIPDWFRQYSSTPKATETGYKPGSFTRKRASDSGRWAGLNSKTTSLSSLGSQRSDRSPLMLSPSAHSHHGGQTGFSRWSTSHLNSTQTSPSVSTRGSFSRGGVANSSFVSGHSAASGASVRNSFRQPYLGWRSQEKLAQPRTPHERLASSLLSQQPQSQKAEPAVTPEIQSSIKEVTSAIVHYVNDQTNRTSRSRSASPNSRKCWLESSFVGIRPLDSPQTPVIENSFNTNTATSSSHSGITATSDGLRMNGVGESTII